MECEENNLLEPLKPSAQERLQDGRACTTCSNFTTCWDVIGDKPGMNLWAGQPKASGKCSIADGLINYEPAPPVWLEWIQWMIDNRTQIKRDLAAERADSFFDREDFDTAIPEYDEAIRLEPDYAKAYFKRGNAYFYKGDYDKAIEDYNLTEKLIPAQRLIMLNEFHDSFEEKILNLIETNLYFYRGDAYFGKKDYDKAIEDYTRFLEEKEEAPEIYIRRGNAYKAKGDMARAEADFAKARKVTDT